jgi:hypothetical protein
MLIFLLSHGLSLWIMDHSPLRCTSDSSPSIPRPSVRKTTSLKWVGKFARTLAAGEMFCCDFVWYPRWREHVLFFPDFFSSFEIKWSKSVVCWLWQILTICRTLKVVFFFPIFLWVMYYICCMQTLMGKSPVDLFYGLVDENSGVRRVRHNFPGHWGSEDDNGTTHRPRPNQCFRKEVITSSGQYRYRDSVKLRWFPLSNTQPSTVWCLCPKHPERNSDFPAQTVLM